MKVVLARGRTRHPARRGDQRPARNRWSRSAIARSCGTSCSTTPTSGTSEFIVCLGYKGEYIKRYFADSLALGADVTIDFATSSVEVLDTPRDDWRVTLVDTGQWTQTAGG